MATVGALIEELQDLIDGGEITPNTEIRWAHQRRHALEYNISGLCTQNTMAEGDEAVKLADTPDENIVYLTEGSQIGYLPGDPWPLETDL
jgi:hypothetical protein